MPSHNTSLRGRAVRALGVTAAIAGLGSLAACGGGGESTGSDADTSTLVIQRSANAGFQPALVAAEQGYFEDEGLDVKIEVASSDITKNIPLVVSGQIQISEAGMSSLISAKARDLPLQAVLGVQNAADGVEPDDGCLAPPGSSISSLKGLEGATVGVPTLGNPTQIINNIAMKNAGADSSTVKYVALAPDALNAAAAGGQVDAICTFGLFYSQALDAGFTALNAGTSGELPGAPQIIWIAKSTFAAEQAETLEKFTAAMERAYDYLNENPDVFRQLTKDNTEQPDEFIDQMLLPEMSTAISRDATSAIAEEMQSGGFIETVPAVGDLISADVPDL